MNTSTVEEEKEPFSHTCAVVHQSWQINSCLRYGIFSLSDYLVIVTADFNAAMSVFEGQVGVNFIYMAGISHTIIHEHHGWCVTETVINTWEAWNVWMF